MASDPRTPTRAEGGWLEPLQVHHLGSAQERLTACARAAYMWVENLFLAPSDASRRVNSLMHNTYSLVCALPAQLVVFFQRGVY